jgi:hypothetical protein
MAGFSGTGEGVLMAVDKLVELVPEYYARQPEERGGSVS